MKNEALTIERAVRQAVYELAQEAGEPMATVTGEVFFNALSDAVIRAESVGINEEKSLMHFLQFCRKVSQLREGQEINDLKKN